MTPSTVAFFTFSFILGYITFTAYSKFRYFEGCSDTMRHLYSELNLNKIDEDSLAQFCRDLRKNK